MRNSGRLTIAVGKHSLEVFSWSHMSLVHIDLRCLSLDGAPSLDATVGNNTQTKITLDICFRSLNYPKNELPAPQWWDRSLETCNFCNCPMAWKETTLEFCILMKGKWVRMNVNLQANAFYGSISVMSYHFSCPVNTIASLIAYSSLSSAMWTRETLWRCGPGLQAWNTVDSGLQARLYLRVGLCAWLGI